MNREFLEKMFSIFIAPLKRQVMGMVGRCIIVAVQDGKGVQTVNITVMKGEGYTELERLQNFGFSSNPPEGSEAAVIAMAGQRNKGSVIACDHRASRPKDLPSGGSVMYSKDGTIIKLANDGTVFIQAATKVYVDSLLVELGQGSLEKILNGQTFQTRFNAHQHYGNEGVPTGPPITLSPASDLSNTVKAKK